MTCISAPPACAGPVEVTAVPGVMSELLATETPFSGKRSGTDPAQCPTYWDFVDHRGGVSRHLGRRYLLPGAGWPDADVLNSLTFRPRDWIVSARGGFSESLQDLRGRGRRVHVQDPDFRFHT